MGLFLPMQNPCFSPRGSWSRSLKVVVVVVVLGLVVVLGVVVADTL